MRSNYYSSMILATGAGVAMLSVAPRAADASVEVLYSKVAGHPTAVVPGALDLSGTPVVTEFKSMLDLIGSPDGSHWFLRASTQQASTMDQVLLVGSGGSGNVIAQRGQPFPGAVGNEKYDFFGSAVGRFNENNDFAFSARAKDGVAAVNHKVFRSIGGTLNLRFQRSDPYTGLIDNPVGASGDELVGNSIGSIHLLNNGAIGADDPAPANLHSSRYPVTTYDLVKFKQPGVDQVLSLVQEFPKEPSFEDIDNISLGTFYTTPDGTRWLFQGRVVAPNTHQDVLVVDGKVVIQEGFEIPGTGVVVNSVDPFGTQLPTITKTILLSNGDWYSRGGWSGGLWAVRNGEVIVKTGDAITGSENWGSSFTAWTGNRKDDWVLAARTDSSDPASDEVIAVNGEIVLREGDMVDLNGNGEDDDDAFIGRGNNTLAAFSANNLFLTDDGVLFFLASLRNGAGADLTNAGTFVPLALLRITVEPTIPCPADVNDDQQVNVDDLLVLLASWGKCAPPCSTDLAPPPDGDGQVNVDDLLVLLAAWGPCN